MDYLTKKAKNAPSMRGSAIRDKGVIGVLVGKFNEKRLRTYSSYLGKGAPCRTLFPYQSSRQNTEKFSAFYLAAVVSAGIEGLEPR